MGFLMGSGGVWFEIIIEICVIFFERSWGVVGGDGVSCMIRSELGLFLVWYRRWGGMFGYDDWWLK